MLKTRKSVAKRFKVTAKNKLMRRAIGQDHFNAKQPGQKTRKLHKSKSIASVNERNIKKHIPHHN